MTIGNGVAVDPDLRAPVGCLQLTLSDRSDTLSNKPPDTFPYVTGVLFRWVSPRTEEALGPLSRESHPERKQHHYRLRPQGLRQLMPKTSCLIIQPRKKWRREDNVE